MFDNIGLLIAPPISIKEFHSNSEFQDFCYPNPAISSVILGLVTEQPTSIDVTIYDHKGVVLYNETVENEIELDITEFSSGLYYYTIQSKNGKNHNHGSFLKQ